MRKSEKNNIKIIRMTNLLTRLVLFNTLGFLSSPCLLSYASTQLYVIPFFPLTNNHSDGSLFHPYSSIKQALDHIEQNYYRNNSIPYRITINLYPTLHFVNRIYITKVHSHIRLSTMSQEDIAVLETRVPPLSTRQ